MTVTLLGTAAGPNGSTVATYRLVPTSGTFANGTYAIWTNPNQTHDQANNFVNEVSLASFWLWF
jgi:hypothetical protein